MRRLPSTFVARVRAIRLLRPGARALLPIQDGELRQLLARRQELLVAGERAAVQAALEAAAPEFRSRLEQLLGRSPAAHL